MSVTSVPINLNKYWRLLSLFQATLLIHVVSYMQSPDVGQSAQFRVLAAVWFGLALVVLSITAGFSRLSMSKILNRTQKFCWIYLICVIGILFTYGVLMRPEWVYAHAGLAMSATAGLTYMTFFADEKLSIHSKWFIVLAGLIGILLIALKINAIAVYPNIIPTDESWLLGWPVAWVRGLYPDDLLFYKGGEDVFHYFIPMGIWMQFVGTGFIQARIYQLLMTLVLMAITFPLVKRLYDNQTAWLSVLMLFAGSVIVLATTIRHDIGLAVLLVASFLVYQMAVEREQTRLHFVAGLIAGFGLFTHYHAIAFGPALMIALYAPTTIRDFSKRGWRPSTDLILYALGGIVGAGIVFGVQILPQLDAVVGAREFRSADIGEMLKSYIQYFEVLSELSQFEFVLIIAGMIGLLMRHRLVDIQILLMILLGHLGLAVLAAQITLDYYVIPLAAFYAIAIVTLFTQTLQHISKPILGWIVLCFVVVNLGMVMSTPIQYALDGKTWDDAPQPQGVQWIQENVPIGSRIIGDIYYFLWLTDYEFYVATSDRYISPNDRDLYPTARDLWMDANPDYLVFDPNILTYNMDRVLDSGFLDDNPDYEIVARIPGRIDDIIIYGRTDG